MLRCGIAGDRGTTGPATRYSLDSNQKRQLPAAKTELIWSEGRPYRFENQKGFSRIRFGQIKGVCRNKTETCRTCHIPGTAQPLPRLGTYSAASCDRREPGCVRASPPSCRLSLVRCHRAYRSKWTEAFLRTLPQVVLAVTHTNLGKFQLHEHWTQPEHNLKRQIRPIFQSYQSSGCPAKLR